jgi:hypothetical protein
MATKPDANGKVVQSMIVERAPAARRYHLTLVLLYAREQLPPRADRSPAHP